MKRDRDVSEKEVETISTKKSKKKSKKKESNGKENVKHKEVLLEDEEELTALQRCQRLLGDYQGRRSGRDASILRSLYTLDAENGGGLLSRLHPLLFDTMAKETYLDNQEWQEIRVSKALELVDSHTMSQSCLSFDIHLSLDVNKAGVDDKVEDGDDLYDPRFFLPWFTSLCSPDSFVDRHWKLLDRGALSLGIAALSSHDKHMRLLGYTLISRVYQQLEGAKIHSEKQLWLHLIDALRRGVAQSVSRSRVSNEDIDGSTSEKYSNDNDGQRKVQDSTEISTTGRVLRLPSLLTVFLVRVINILRSPLDPLHKRISSFILAKPVLSLFNVPDFLRLLHSTEARRHEERSLLMSVLIEGTKDALDVNVLQQDYVIKMLLSLHDSHHIMDGQYRRQVRRLLLSVARVSKGAFGLLRGQGVLTWVANAWNEAPRVEKNEGVSKARWELLSMLSTAWSTVLNSLLASGKTMPIAMAMETHLLLQQLSSKPTLLTEDMWRCVVQLISLVDRASKTRAEDDEEKKDFEVCLQESVTILKSRMKESQLSKDVRKELRIRLKKAMINI